MNYWNFIRKPRLKVLPIQVLISIIFLPIGYFISQFIIIFVFNKSQDDPQDLYILEGLMLISGLLLIAGIVNFVFYLKSIIKRNKNIEIISSKVFILASLILISVLYIFIPKTTQTVGGLCDGCQSISCSCFGIEYRDFSLIDSYKKCIGVRFSCKTETMHL